MLGLVFLGLFLLCETVIAESQERICVRATLPQGAESINCVCNSTYCDAFPSVPDLKNGQVFVLTSSKSGKRFASSLANFTSGSPNRTVITVDAKQQRQKIIGFGGAFTDAATIMISSLSKDTRLNLLKTYFADDDGIGYNIGRVPIASCDFSTHAYSYDDVANDTNLSNFNLAVEDLTHKIPTIKDAQNLTKTPILLFGSPWSAPGWMKSNGKMKGAGYLLGDYNQTYANYFVRFFEEYNKQGIKFWGLTPQKFEFTEVPSNYEMLSEPNVSSDPNFWYQAMYFTPEGEANFVKNFLVPTLKNNSLTKDLIIMGFDHNRVLVPEWPLGVLDVAADVIAGSAVHWYDDDKRNASVLTDLHNKYPEKFILYTEACAGFRDDEHNVSPGNWSRGDEYAESILDELNNWGTGWVDWNMALDKKGGPNWVNNYVDAPIIVYNDSDSFQKQPLFYVTGHFSKLLTRDSVYVVSTQNGSLPETLKWTTFIDPNNNNRRVMVIHNSGVQQVSFSVVDKAKSSQFFNLDVEASSIVTLVWPSQSASIHYFASLHIFFFIFIFRML